MLDEISDNRKVIVAVRVRPKLEGGRSAMHNAERFHPECIHRISDTGVRIVDTSCVVGLGKQVQGTSGGNMGSSNVATRSSSFVYDMVFDKDCTQLEVYEETTLDAIDAALHYGCNASVITYGQTGSGKTFTVLGAVGNNPLDSDIITPDTGLFLRILKDLLEYAEAREKDKHIIICLSVTEIYLDTVRDLLIDTNSGRKANSPLLPLKLIIDDDNVRIPDLTYCAISQLQDAVKAYKIATKKRMCRATDSNDTSSRSHALFNIEVFQQKRIESVNPEPMELSDILAIREKQQGVTNGGSLASTIASLAESGNNGQRSNSPPQSLSSSKNSYNNQLPIPDMSQASNPLIKVGNGVPPIVCSKIVVTDLAGSEKLKHSNSKGTSFDEMKKINASLTALGNVVHSLYTGSKHVPYRDSKLTVLLRTYFASKTCRVIMIANVSPTSLSFDETLSTMFFADKVKTMKADNSSTSALCSTVTEAARVEVEVLKLQKELEDATGDLRILRGGYFGYAPVTRKFLRSDVKFTHLIEDQTKLKVFQESSVYGARPVEKGIGNNVSVLPLPKEIMKAISENTALVVAAKHAEYQKDVDRELELALNKSVVECMGDYTKRMENAKKFYSEQIKFQEEVIKEYNNVVEELLKKIEPVEKILKRLEDEMLVPQKRKHDMLTSCEKAAIQEKELTSRLNEIEGEFNFRNKGEHETWLKFKQNLELEDHRHSIYMNYYQSRHVNYMIPRQQYINLLLENAQKSKEYIGAQTALERYETTRWIITALNIMAGNAVARSIKKEAQAACQRAKLDASYVDPNVDMDSGRMNYSKRKIKSTFDEPNLLNWINVYMSNGCSLLKYRSNGNPHYRMFHLIINEEASTVRLYWDAEGSTRVPGDSACSYVDLFNVKKIVLGKCSDVFARAREEREKLKFPKLRSSNSSSLFQDEDYYTSFTVHFMKSHEEKTLNITCETVAEMEAWVAGLCNISQVNPFFGHMLSFASTDGQAQQTTDSDNIGDGYSNNNSGKAQMLNTREYQHLREYCTLDAELLLCERWHIHPKLWHATKTRIIAIGQRQSFIHNRDGDGTPYQKPPVNGSNHSGTLQDVNPCRPTFVPVVMTPGELRQMMQVDIFRANACWILLVAEGYIERPRECMTFLDFDKE